MKTKRKRNFIAVGQVKIPWYRATDGRTLIDARSFGRKVCAFRDHETALVEARRIAVEINGGGTEILALTAADRAAYAKVSTIATARGRDVTSAIMEWDDAWRLIAAEPALDGITLSEAVAAGLASLRVVTHTVPAVVEELLSSKRGSDLDGRYWRQLQRHLRDFSAVFPGDLRKVEVRQIETWIKARVRQDGEPLSAARRNHVRGDIIHLFKFARTRGYLPDQISAAQSVPEFGSKAEKKNRRIDVFSPAQMRLLLEHVEHAWLPYVATAGFSGARPEEIVRSYHAAKRKDTLRWEDFDWDEREIIVREEVDKNGFARRCPILDNLWEILAPWRDAKCTGPIAAGSLEKFRQRLKKRLRTLLDDADKADSAQHIIAWPHDVLRHSYGTYRMASSGRNVHQVAAEMGNSPAIVRKHYDKVGPRSHGKAWFSITLGTEAPNVVQLSLFRG